MRVYTVVTGDTAESIAAKDEHASCPKCSRDLVLANAHRARVQHPNGYLTFVDPLVPGERLWIPDKWRNEVLDALPREYFDNLPARPTGLGQLPPEHLPQRYEIQPGDTAEGIALKFGQRSSETTAQLIEANPTLPTVIQQDGTHVLCSLAAGQILALPDLWFAAGSTWAAIKPGCNPFPQDVAASPGAAAQLADLNHPPPKVIALSVHPGAIDALHAASGGPRDAASTAGTIAAGTGAVVGTAVVGTVLTQIGTGTLMHSAERYLGNVIDDLF